jgi:exodeoxyribonuclease-3
VKYTYWSYKQQARLRDKGWRIDYILTSKNLKVLKAEIHTEVQGSDHCPIST